MIEVIGNRCCALRFLGMLLLGSVCAMFGTPSARADTTYNYTGKPFTNFSLYPGSPLTFDMDACTAGVGECYLSIAFTLASPLPDNFPYAVTSVNPLSFSITDGVNMLTQLDSDGYIAVGTGPDGEIDEWSFQADSTIGQDLIEFASGGPPGGDYTDTLSPYAHGVYQTGFASNSDDPGTWTMSTTPEPSSLILLGTGLLGLAFGLRRKRVGRSALVS